MQLLTSMAGRIALLICFALSPSALAQTYAVVDFLVPTRTMSEDVFQRNQTEVLDGMGMGTGMFVVGTAPRLVLDFEHVAAGRLTVGHRFDEFGVQGSYLRTDTWDALASTSDVSEMLASPFTLIGVAVNPAVDRNTFAVARYQSELESLEVNLTQLIGSGPSGDVTLLFGGRALSIDETFTYSSTNAMMTNDLLSTAENRLIGPQLGLQAATPAPGGFVDITVKGALAYNEVKTTSDFNGTMASGALGRAAVVGELNVEYAFTPTPNTAIRIGFQLLALGDVGLATNTPIIAGDATDAVFYSAPYVGAVFVH